MGLSIEDWNEAMFGHDAFNRSAYLDNDLLAIKRFPYATADVGGGSRGDPHGR